MFSFDKILLNILIISTITNSQIDSALKALRKLILWYELQNITLEVSFRCQQKTITYQLQYTFYIKPCILSGKLLQLTYLIQLFKFNEVALVYNFYTQMWQSFTHKPQTQNKRIEKEKSSAPNDQLSYFKLQKDIYTPKKREQARQYKTLQEHPNDFPLFVKQWSEAEEKSSTQKRKLPHRHPWSKEENQLLKNLVYKHGARDWPSIAEFFQHRGAKQCRERWYNHLKDGVKKDQWSQNEEWLLALGVKAYGNKWSKISSFLPGRAQNSVKNHWNSKMKKRRAQLQQKILELVGQRKQTEGCEIQKLLIEIIRNQDVYTYWQKEELSKKQIRIQCKQALIDFFKLKIQFEENQRNQID